MSESTRMGPRTEKRKTLDAGRMLITCYRRVVFFISSVGHVLGGGCRGAQRCAHAKPTPEKPTQRALTYDDQPSALISKPKKSYSVINSKAPRYRLLIRLLGPN